MAGKPKKRHREEVAKLHGKVTTPEPADQAADLETLDVSTKEALAKIKGAPVKGKRGASAEYMRALVKRRQELAKTDPSKAGGRARTRYSRKEIEQNAMAALVPTAIKVLKQQLESEDEAIAHRAAVKILEWEKGKPAQTINQNSDSVHTIRYETIVTMPAEFRELPAADAVFEELTEGDGE